jgi:hypothetical protein
LASAREAGNGSFESLFLHFTQYKAHSWILGDYFLTVVLPKRSSPGFTPGNALLERMPRHAENEER